MIFIHTYGIGKFAQKQVRRVYDSEKEAMDQVAVLGGVVQCFVEKEGCITIEELEQMRHVLTSEVSEIIDSFSGESLGSAGSHEPGSPEWDCHKVRAMNMVNQIIDGDY